MRILIVLTSTGSLGAEGSRTGFCFDELAAAYLMLLAAGTEVVIASPDGGAPPIDPEGYDPANLSEVIRRFLAQPGARDALQDTLELHRIEASDFDAVFYPGGVGLLADLPYDEHSISLLTALHKADRPMAFVSEGSAALCRVRDEAGRPIVAGRNITLIGATEGGQRRLSPTGPGLPEQELRAAGANVVRAAEGDPHVVSDGFLITGQNGASAIPVVNALLAALAQRASQSTVSRFDPPGNDRQKG